MLRAVVAVLVFAGLCQGQIDLSELYEPNSPIEVRCACALPPGAVLRVTWDVSENVHQRAHPAGESALYLWAAPGVHSVTMLQMVDYPETMEVLVPTSETDPTPVRKVITVYTRPSEFNRYTKEFTVKGAKPNPGPEPEPEPEPEPVGEPAHFVWIYESAKQTPREAGIWDKFNTNRPLGVRVYKWDKDAGGTNPSAATWIALADHDKLPWYLLVAKDGKTILKQGTVPKDASYEDIVKGLK